MVQRTLLRELSQRRGDLAGKLRHAVHCKLRARLSLGVGTGGAARLRRAGTAEEPGALANRRDRWMDIGIRGRLLGDDAHYPAFGADIAARPVGGLLQAVLSRRRKNLTRQRSVGC